MILTGIFKGQESKPYDFVNPKGENIKGVSNTAFVELTDEGINPSDRLQKVKLPNAEYVCIAKVGSPVSWIVDVKWGKVVLVSEIALSKK